jgi:heat shock protein HspQ
MPACAAGCDLGHNRGEYRAAIATRPVTGAGWSKAGRDHWLLSEIRPISCVMTKARIAKFPIGAVVKHRLFSFRGVVFDIDPVFDNTDEWYEAIPPEIRPHKDQPFYHLFAENSETEYVAYVSEQNLLPDDSGKPLRHPQVKETFERGKDGNYRPREQRLN